MKNVIRNLKSTLTATVLLCLLIFSVACNNNKPAVKVIITPEQSFALTKITAQAAASGIAIRIASLEAKPVPNASKIRILKAAKGFIDEFNAQVADVTAVDLSSREKVRAAIDKAVAAADHLTATDVLQLNDPLIQADINAVLNGIKSAVKSFDVFFPEVQPVP